MSRKRRNAASALEGSGAMDGPEAALAFLTQLYGNDRRNLLSMLARRRNFLRRYGTAEDLLFLIEIQCAARKQAGSEPLTAEQVTLQ